MCLPIACLARHEFVAVCWQFCFVTVAQTCVHLQQVWFCVRVLCAVVSIVKCCVFQAKRESQARMLREHQAEKEKLREHIQTLEKKLQIKRQSPLVRFATSDAEVEELQEQLSQCQSERDAYARRLGVSLVGWLHWALDDTMCVCDGLLEHCSFHSSHYIILSVMLATSFHLQHSFPNNTSVPPLFDRNCNWRHRCHT